MRLVATDLDGTLVRNDFTIGVRSVAALERVHGLGGAVVLVTGRPIRWLYPVYEHLPIQPLAVVANGAAVYDPVDDKVLHSRPLEPAAIAEACARLRSAVPGVRFAVETDGGRVMLHEPAYEVGGWEIRGDGVHEVHIQELAAQPAAKLLVNAGAQPPDAFTALVADLLEGVAEATHSSSSGIVEVSAAGVTKAAGLAWVAERLGVAPHEVVAFGDMPNDLPMFAWSGRGVAVANAHPAVLAAADDVTAANDADGVAAYLERLLDA
ncbi:HAD family phosphatase [Planosporangium flavigriseum]|uniref:Haloacid dehalogenase n=1 Tax=Planosporangium flavigriseum TaxID=373681 RepID=A0A8J3PJK1_9ACTN|nr:HAD family hydrolase [Planosporangium flavigriseum]NJC64605.1 HAD family phosphatase [Planosporangium flavigriseum]GIG71912.1 haloacid dehalogenase [Planosporangium flavigriseum]